MNKWWIRSAGLPRYFTFTCFQTKVFAWHCPTARSAPTKMHTWLGKPGLTHLATSFANKQTSPDHPQIRWRWRTTNISILSCKKHLTCRCFIISIFALGIWHELAVVLRHGLCWKSGTLLAKISSCDWHCLFAFATKDWHAEVRCSIFVHQGGHGCGGSWRWRSVRWIPLVNELYKHWAAALEGVNLSIMKSIPQVLNDFVDKFFWTSTMRNVSLLCASEAWNSRSELWPKFHEQLFGVEKILVQIVIVMGK